MKYISHSLTLPCISSPLNTRLQIKAKYSSQYKVKMSRYRIWNMKYIHRDIEIWKGIYLPLTYTPLPLVSSEHTKNTKTIFLKGWRLRYRGKIQHLISNKNIRLKQSLVFEYIKSHNHCFALQLVWDKETTLTEFKVLL